jgi:hypothetical protein
VILLDAAERIALVNPALREMLLLGGDAQGKTLLEAIRHAELKELLDEARDSSEPLTAEIEVSGIKPRRIVVRVAHVPGDDRQRFAVFVDVTEVRRLESMRRPRRRYKPALKTTPARGHSFWASSSATRSASRIWWKTCSISRTSSHTSCA